MAEVFYNRALRGFLNGNFNFPVDTVKVALVKNTYTPNIDTDEFFSHIASHEVTGPEYNTPGGKPLLNVNIDVVNLVGSIYAARVFADPLEFGPGAYLTFRYAVLYKELATENTSPLIGYWDFGSDQNVNNGTLVLDPGDNGLCMIKDRGL